MGNKKYYLLLATFTVLFFICMLLCINGYRSVSRDFSYESRDGRMERLELDEKMGGPDRIYSTLYFDHDYEKEFDDYWEFAVVYQAYIRGRFGDEPEAQIAVIEAYIDQAKDSLRKEAAQGYIEQIKNRP